MKRGSSRLWWSKRRHWTYGPTWFERIYWNKRDQRKQGFYWYSRTKRRMRRSSQNICFSRISVRVSEQTGNFFCWVQGHLSKKITWRKLGSSFSYDSTADGVLHIKNVQRSHIGSYLCTVFTNYGVFRALTILGIKGEPFYSNSLCLPFLSSVQI